MPQWQWMPQVVGHFHGPPCSLVVLCCLLLRFYLLLSEAYQAYCHSTHTGYHNHLKHQEE